MTLACMNFVCVKFVQANEASCQMSYNIVFPNLGRSKCETYYKHSLHNMPVNTRRNNHFISSVLETKCDGNSLTLFTVSRCLYLPRFGCRVGGSCANVVKCVIDLSKKIDLADAAYNHVSSVSLQSYFPNAHLRDSTTPMYASGDKCRQ